MRMWGIEPSKLCNKHLLGEHVEMHMFIGTLRKGINIEGYITNGLLNPREIINRHDDLVEEMKKRGMNHQSPLEYDCSVLPNIPLNIQANIEDLKSRNCNCKL